MLSIDIKSIKDDHVPVKTRNTKIMLDEIDLYVTRSCNLQCGFCSVNATLPGEPPLPQLTLEEIKSVVEQGIAFGLKEVHVTGGEPCLRNDLDEIILFLSQKGLNIRLITNGTLLTREKLIHLKTNGLESIMFSLDGLPGNHDRMRGTSGAWKRTAAAVDSALALGFKTRISSAAFKNNLPDIPPLMTLMAKKGVHIFSVFLGSPLGRGGSWKELLVKPEEWFGFIHTLKEHVKKIDAKIPNQMQIIVEQGYIKKEQTMYNPDIIKGRGTGCRTLMSHQDFIIIREDGEMYPCVFFIHHGPSLGNIKNGPLEKTLQEAYKRGDYKSFTRLNSFCSLCQDKTLCYGGCRGYAYIYTSRWNAKDPRCREKTMEKKAPGFFPLCPIAKLNIRSNVIQGSSEHALAGE